MQCCIFSEDYHGVDGFVLLKASSVHLKDKQMTQNIYQMTVLIYCILAYFGIIVKQSIKIQCYKKT